MLLLDGFTQLSTSLHQPSSRSARCSNAHASITRMTTLYRSTAAFTRSGRQFGNPIPQSRRPSSGWETGDLPVFCKLPPISIGQETDNFSQQALGKNPGPAIHNYGNTTETQRVHRQQSRFSATNN